MDRAAKVTQLLKEAAKCGIGDSSDVREVIEDYFCQPSSEFDDEASAVVTTLTRVGLTAVMLNWIYLVVQVRCHLLALLEGMMMTMMTTTKKKLPQMTLVKKCMPWTEPWICLNVSTCLGRNVTVLAS